MLSISGLMPLRQLAELCPRDRALTGAVIVATIYPRHAVLPFLVYFAAYTARQYLKHSVRFCPDPVII